MVPPTVRTQGKKTEGDGGRRARDTRAEGDGAEGDTGEDVVKEATDDAADDKGAGEEDQRVASGIVEGAEHGGAEYANAKDDATEICH